MNFVPRSARTVAASGGTEDQRSNRGQEFGRFRVIGVLGHGTFGTVYRALDPLLEREVALKVPRFSAEDRAMVERFHREARAAARLHHPNIVTLYESGGTDDGPYLVAELIEGIPLSQLLRERRPDRRDAVDWVRQIAEGLHYAHGEGIIHRDIKPSNIMMNSARRPQIMDFGLARRDTDIEAGMTVEGQIVGTPSYMSPEQARGSIADVGPHSDQYSVGVVLYEMLCGRCPFVGEPWSIISRVASLNESPPSPRSICPDLPRDLEACCLKALEKDPKSRYPNLLALADDLDHWLKGLPLAARPISSLEQLQRWCRRNRLVASLMGTVALMIVVATIVGYGLAFRFRALAASEAKAAKAAEAARQEEEKARLNGERLLIDAYTESGLTADRNRDPREAVLWFANAVAASENHPLRERHNRIRLQAWLPQVATPVQAFQQTLDWTRSLAYHPSGRYLLSHLLSGKFHIFELESGVELPVPEIGIATAAAWSPDGSHLALASLSTVVVFEFPGNSEVDRWDHSDLVNSLQFSSSGGLLLVGGEATAQIRNVDDRSFRIQPIPLGGKTRSQSIGPNDRWFAVRSDDERVRVFSMAPDQGVPDHRIPSQPAASPGELPPLFVDENRLVIINNHHSATCWDLEERSIVWEYDVGRVLSSAASPDGRWIALGDDFKLVLLDAATGEPMENQIVHPNLINTIRFHPESDLLLTASEDHKARIFAVPSGELVGSAVSHASAVHRCEWSPDGTCFATVDWGAQLIREWTRSDLHRDLPQRTVVAPESSRGPFVRFNDRGDRWIPSGFDNGRTRIGFEVVEVSSGKAVGPLLAADGLISDADFVPASDRVVLVGGGSKGDAFLQLDKQSLDGPGFVRCLDSESGTPVFDDVTTPSQPIAVRASAVGETVVVLCHSGQVLLIDPRTGEVRAQHDGFQGQVATYGYVIRDRIRFSPQGDQFAIWGSGDRLEILSPKDGRLIRALEHPGGFIHDVQYSPDGKQFATCSSGHTVQLWDSSTGSLEGQPLSHSGWVFSAQFSRDGSHLLTASSDQQARIWDLAAGRAILATREHGDQVFSVFFLPGEELFLASTRDGMLTAWDAKLGKMMAPPQALTGMIYQVSINGSGSRIVASGRNDPGRILDWKRWIPEPDLRLSRLDVQLLGEIVSSQRVHESGAATNLTEAEWWQRWITYRTRHSGHRSRFVTGNPN